MIRIIHGCVRQSPWAWVYTSYWACLLVGLLTTSCGKQPPQTPTTESPAATPSSATPWFEDVVANSGVDFRHESGATGDFLFPEIATGGVCLFDYDGDGDLDIYFVQGGSVVGERSEKATKRLYRNNGNWKFEDVTVASGVGDRGYGMGCACGDFNSDGFIDLYVTNLDGNVLYRNNGNGTFADVTTAAGVRGGAWSTSAAFADIDDDGDLDLYVANYIHWTRGEERACINFASRDYCSPLNYNRPAMDTLYRNQGNGVFEDISKSAELDQKFGNSFGVVTADFNEDGRLDFYIANDGDGNQLWINQGNGRFEDEALLSGCAYDWRGWAQAGMGVTVVDVDHDGDTDLFTTNLYEECNTLFVNQGGHFEDRTVRFGLDAPSRGRTGFGVGFADFDHDGQLDLYVANGAVKYSSAQIRAGDPYAETNLVFRATPSGSFETVSPPGGTASPLVATSRAAAFGDLDGDGDIDVVVVNKDGPPHLLRNLVGQDRNWIMLQVLDHRGNDAIGARVTLELPDRRQVRIVQRAYSYCASNDVRCHFGLGSTATAAPVVVTWLDGRTERFGPLAHGAVHTLREGAGKTLANPKL